MTRILFIVLFFPVVLSAQNNIKASNEKKILSENTSVSNARVTGVIPTETFVAGNERNIPDDRTSKGAVSTNTTGTVSNKRDIEDSKPNKE